MWTFILLLLPLVVHLSTDVNIARYKQAYQSSTSRNRLPYLAVDGKPMATDALCTFTNKETNPWWAVDLQLRHVITKVVITNLAVTPSQLGNFIIGATYNSPTKITPSYTNMDVCFRLAYAPRSGETRFECASVTRGRYVVIQMQETKELRLCEVLVFGYVVDNLALDKPAYQSSTDHNAPAVLATDGSRAQTFSDGSCTQTRKENKPWWVVDLQNRYFVDEVVLTNRGDCCEDRLRQFRIGISRTITAEGRPDTSWQHVCANYHGQLQAAESRGFKCLSTGRYVVVTLTITEALALCEVEIYGKRNDLQQAAGKNLALNKPAYQSSTTHNGAATRATDGNKNQQWLYGSCTHTKDQNKPWWVVDLQGRYYVDVVVVTNRGDCCENRLKNFLIGISSTITAYGRPDTNIDVCAEYQGASGPKESLGFKCERIGRYVVVSLTTTEVLTLCEVEIYGSRNEIEPVAEVNLARGRPTLQSSTLKGGVSDRAVDGQTNGQYNNGPCTLTSKTKPWWAVDLVQRHWVDNVVLWNRDDCWRRGFYDPEVCWADRLVGAEIETSLNHPQSYMPHFYIGCREQRPTTGAIRSTTFQCGRPGKWVVLYTRRRVELSICEIEVYGHIEQNLALDKYAMQSSTYENYGAQLAVDGSRNPVFSSGSCSHTDKQSYPWWAVDLQRKHHVTSVELTNRDDNSNRLSNFKIGLMNQNPVAVIMSAHLLYICASDEELGSSETRDYKCGKAKKRYVVVLLDKFDFLTLCEVAVFGWDIYDNADSTGVFPAAARDPGTGLPPSVVTGNTTVTDGTSRNSTLADHGIMDTIRNNVIYFYIAGAVVATTTIIAVVIAIIRGLKGNKPKEEDKKEIVPDK